MTSAGNDIEQWDRYWAYGNIHSFSQVAGGNYQGGIAAFWQARFRALAPGSRVLDIATGNGAIPLLALAESDRSKLDLVVTGVDLAAIDPAREVTDPSLKAALERVAFHGRTAAESLPLADASVDLACSQFGLEYSDLGRSVPEIARVLKAGGRLAAIAHHRDSVLLQATHRELAQLDFVLNEVKLYLRARNLLRAMPGAGPDSSKVRRKRQALQEAMTSIEQAAGQSPSPTMLLGPAQYIREILSAIGRVSPGELMKWLDEAWARVAANQRRLQDMKNAALDDGAVAELRALLERAGLAGPEVEPFRQDDGALLGWRVEAARPD